MRVISAIIAMFLLVTSSMAFAAQGPAASGAEAAPVPQTMQQTMEGKPEISGDGINNASQVDDPADIGRAGSVNPDAPEPEPLEGSAGAQEAK